MSDSFAVQSHKGAYTIHFMEAEPFILDENMLQNSHIIIDKKLIELHPHQFKAFSSSSSLLVIDAYEKNKSLEKMPIYVDHLVKNKLRRHHQLIAIGGGIIQDITCFLAANMLRGVDWWFVPTTLLAQADSCIGSKSSINCGESKNILGTFTPPKKIMIHMGFLNTLDTHALRSGVGEMLKVHAIEGTEAFRNIAQDYDTIFDNTQCMSHYIRRSLEIKKAIIEEDEFDRGTRQVMNYGHTFGHAIESATQYKIPHGIAVTIGMDMANYIASRSAIAPPEHYEQMHAVLKKNYIDYSDEFIPLESFWSAISKDKKNIDNQTVSLILPNQIGKPSQIFFPYDDVFRDMCADYLSGER